MLYQSEVEQLRSQGGSEEEQRQVLEQHEKDLAALVNRIDADRMRMKSTLAERLARKKEDRLRQKQQELVGRAEDARDEMEQRQNNQRHRMKADEVQLNTLSNSLHAG